MSAQAPTMLLEIKVISANDLPPLARMLRTYVVAGLDHDNRSHTAVDRQGGTNPTWNHKFSFYVDDSFLNSKTSEIKFEIYNVAWLRDLPMGAASLVIGTIFPPLSPKNPTVRPFALRLRRPTGHLQGILNVGIQLKDNLIGPPESTIGSQKPPVNADDKVPITLELQNYNGDEGGEHQNMRKECKTRKPSETASFFESITTAYEEEKSLLSCVTEQSNNATLRSAVRSSGKHRVTSSEMPARDYWEGDVENDCLAGNSIFESWMAAAAARDDREGESEKNMKKESFPVTGKDKGSRRGCRKYCLHRRCESEGGRGLLSFSAKLKLICGISIVDKKKRPSRRKKIDG